MTLFKSCLPIGNQPDSMFPKCIIYASSSMSMFALQYRIQNLVDLGADLNEIWVISSNNKAQLIFSKIPNLLVIRPSLRSLFLRNRCHTLIREHIRKSGLKSIIFYDFAEDLGVFLVAKTALHLRLHISILPSAPLPCNKVKISDFIMNNSFNFKKRLLYLLLKFLCYPASLYSYGLSLTSRRKPHIRISHSSIHVKPYVPVQQLHFEMILPKSIKYLYIENCECLLGSLGLQLVNKILASLAQELLLLGKKLYVKPRMYNSVLNNDNRFNYDNTLTSQPCEKIDMSSCTLITIASIGALAKPNSTVISILSVLMEDLSIHSHDKVILQTQLDYVRSFSHPKLIIPRSKTELFELLN